MRTTKHRWFWIWDFDREEKWLNEMAAKGFVLVSVGFGSYQFDDCRPGAYNIRLELLENLPAHAESVRYIQFLEDTGAEYLGSITRWVYFRKKTESGEFNLFSDNESRIRHLNRMLSLLGILTMMMAFFGISNLLVEPRRLLGLICLGVGAWMGYGFARVSWIKHKLKKEQQLFE